MQVSQETCFLCAGLAVILLSIFFSKQIGNSPVQLDLEKIGVNFKADRVALLFVIGFIITATGIFIKVKNYENTVNELQKNSDQINWKVSQLEDDLKEFKEYELGLRVIFPDKVNPEKYIIQIQTKKTGEGLYKLQNVTPELGPGGVYVQLSDLTKGEKIKISAVNKENNRDTWESDEIEIPITTTTMKERNN